MAHVIPPEFPTAEPLAARWAQHECAEASVVPTLCHVGRLLSLVHSSSDGKVQIFELSRPLATEKLYITVLVQKGSLLTYIWSLFARLDEEYVALLSHDLHSALQLRPDVLVSDGATQGGRTQNLHALGQPVLWHMRGADIKGSEGTGAVDWAHMASLQAFTGVRSLGLLAFAKQLVKLMISLPLFAKCATFVVPMPATAMMSCMFLRSTCPLIAHDDLTEFQRKTLLPLARRADGSGAVLSHYAPYWLASGFKVLHCLCDIHCDSQLLRPLQCGPGRPDDCVVRIVELFQIAGSPYGLVEVVDACTSVRYVVTDVMALAQAAAAAVLSRSDHQCAPDIAILDCVEWRRLMGHQPSLQSRMQSVDFHNSSQWGRPNVKASAHID